MDGLEEVSTKEGKSFKPVIGSGVEDAVGVGVDWTKGVLDVVFEEDTSVVRVFVGGAVGDDVFGGKDSVCSGVGDVS